jgi:PAS domain S-box-containing protein
MTAVITWLQDVVGSIPLSVLEIWGRVSYLIGWGLAVSAFGGFTFRLGDRWGFGRERQAWDEKAFVSIPLTFVLIVVSGYVGSFVVLVPGAQTFESLKDLIVLLCVVLFGYPALLIVPFAYGLSDLIEGVPPDFILDWLPGYFMNPACFWVAYQFFGKDPDFRRARTWGRYLAFVLIFLAIEPVLWGFVCSGKFTPEISYRAITPALLFTTSVTWIIGPFAMLGALPLARRVGLFWAEIPGHVREQRLGGGSAIWEAGRGEAEAAAGTAEQSLPIRMFILAPFIALLLVMVGATAVVALWSAEGDAHRLAARLHREMSDNLTLRLDDYLASVQGSAAVPQTAGIVDLLRRLPIASEGRAFIVDHSGAIRASSVAGVDAVTTAAIDGLRRAAGGLDRLDSAIQFQFDYITPSPSRETWLAQATPYSAGSEDWIVITAMPEAFYLAGVREGNSRSAMVFALALLLCLGVAAVLASAVTAPLRRISTASTALARGDLTQRVPGSRLEELGALAESFNHMAAQLKGTFDDLQFEVDVRKRRESELQASEDRAWTSEERLQLAIRAAGLGIWDWDVEKDELIWDDSMYRLYGLRRDQFGGAFEAWSRCLLEEDQQRAMSDVQAALHGERTFASDFRVRRDDGAVRVIRGVAETIRAGDGRPVRMVGINWDVTER